MSIDFFQTGMGQKFFESDFPKLVNALERIVDKLEEKEKEEKKKEELRKYIPAKDTDDLDDKFYHSCDRVCPMLSTGGNGLIMCYSGGCMWYDFEMEACTVTGLEYIPYISETLEDRK